MYLHVRKGYFFPYFLLSYYFELFFSGFQREAPAGCWIPCSFPLFFFSCHKVVCRRCLASEERSGVYKAGDCR